MKDLPIEFLVIALTTVIGLLYKLVLERAKKTEDTLAQLAHAVAELDKKFIGAATIEQLGRMGDRFDGRITSLAQDVAVMKAVASK